jgi:hypothetical protein
MGNFGRAMIIDVRGLVQGCRRRAGIRYTRVLIPSVDAYSGPQLVEISSRSRLGRKHDEISCSCILRGSEQILRKQRKGKSVKTTHVEHTLALCEVVDG